MCVGGRINGRCIGCPPAPAPIKKPMPAPAPAPISVPHPIVSPSLPEAVVRKEGEQVVVPLTGVITTVTIKDFIAEVAIKQRFENTETVPIEAVYEFPVDPKFAVCAFRAEIDGKVIEGKIKEKQKARETYDDAIAQGHGAYLLEEKDNQPTVFSASVGNLPAGKAVLLTITYVTELDFEDGKLKYVLPTQPYAPNGRDPTPKFTNPKSQEYVKDVPYGLRVNVKFDMTSNIKSISSPSHPINFEFGDSPKNATVQLIINESGAPLVKDFVVTTALFDPHQPCVRIEDIGGGKKAALVALYPKMDEEGDVFTEMIFVVDQSGSMAGSRMNSVKETLQIFLRSIPEGTLFNIVGFGTSTKSLFKESKEYNDASLATAVAFVEKMFANLGGTNIIKPLLEIFGTASKPGVPRQLFLLTDGEVNNTQECIDTVRKHASSTRVFTFGIGNDASKELVTGMADAGEGKAEFVRPGDNMEEKVLRQLQRALKPAFTDLAVEWGDQKCIVQQAPYRLPPVFSGQRVIVYGVFGGDVANAQVTLKAATPKGPFTTSVPLSAAAAQPGKLIFRLASRALIRDLTEKRSYMHDNAYKLTGKYKEEDVKKETIALSIASGVASSLTSFVAVEERSEATIGEMQLRKVALAPAANAPSGPPPPPAMAPMAALNYSAPPPPPPGMAPQMQYQQAPQAFGGWSAAPPMAPPSYGAAPLGGGAPPGARPGAGRGGPPPAPRISNSSSVSYGMAPPPPPMAEEERERRSSPRNSSLSAAAPQPMRRLSSEGASKGASKDKEKKESKSKVSEASSSRKKLSAAPVADLMSVAEARDEAEAPSGSYCADEEMDSLVAAPKPLPLAAAAAAPAPPSSSSSSFFSFLSSASSPPSAPSAPSGAYASAPPPAAGPAPTPAPAPASSAGLPDVSVLIKQASASGSFPLAALTSVFPRATLDKVRAALPAGTSGAQAEAIMITAIIVAVFASRYGDRKINWDLVAQKARKWIKKEAAAIKADSADWDAAAQKFLAASP